MPAIGHTERMFPLRQSQQRRTGGLRLQANCQGRRALATRVSMAARLPDPARRAPQCAKNEHWKAMYLNHGRVLKDRNARVPSRISEVSMSANPHTESRFHPRQTTETRAGRAPFRASCPTSHELRRYLRKEDAGNRA